MPTHNQQLCRQIACRGKNQGNSIKKIQSDILSTPITYRFGVFCFQLKTRETLKAEDEADEVDVTSLATKMFKRGKNTTLFRLRQKSYSCFLITIDSLLLFASSLLADAILVTSSNWHDNETLINIH